MFSFQAPRNIEFGPGVSLRLPQYLKTLGLDSPLVVTSAGMKDREGFIRFIDLLDSECKNVAVFAEVTAEPPIEILEAAVDFARRHDIDSVIGIGGGSAIDIAKLTALLLKEHGPIERLYGVGNVPARGLPTFMVPTTTGSGSEVTANAVLLAPTQKTKVGVVDPNLIPDGAFIDTELVATLPAKIVATSGMDALTHALEAYVSRNSSPISDALAFKAIKTIVDNIAEAVPDHGPARGEMLIASTMAGLAFSNAGTGAVHAFSYPLSGMFGMGHGMANALMLPYIVEFNREATNKYDELSGIFKGDIVEALFDLRKKIDIPDNLVEAGIDPGMCTAMAEVAVNVKRHLAVNPREIDFDDAVKIFSKAMV